MEWLLIMAGVIMFFGAGLAVVGLALFVIHEIGGFLIARDERKGKAAS